MAQAPFRGFWDMQSEFDRMFNDMVGDMFGRRRAQTVTKMWAPRLEAYTRGGDLVLHVDLPGCQLQDVDITLDGNVLTISGERKPVTEEGIKYYLEELPYGIFRRTVTVPEGVDADSIKARLDHGVLEVVLPGAVREIEPKKIAIESSETKSLEGSAS